MQNNLLHVYIYMYTNHIEHILIHIESKPSFNLLQVDLDIHKSFKERKHAVDRTIPITLSKSPGRPLNSGVSIVSLGMYPIGRSFPSPTFILYIHKMYMYMYINIICICMWMHYFNVKYICNIIDLLTYLYINRL